MTTKTSGNWLVRNGLALDWPEYSKRKYDGRLDAGCGQAAMSSRGYTGYVFGRAEARPIARMTPVLILDEALAYRKTFSVRIAR